MTTDQSNVTDDAEAAVPPAAGAPAGAASPPDAPGATGEPVPGGDDAPAAGADPEAAGTETGSEPDATGTGPKAEDPGTGAAGAGPKINDTGPDDATTDAAEIDKTAAGPAGTDPETGGPKADGAEAGAAKAAEDGADEPADPWARFAPAQERLPGRLRRIVRATGRGLIHEWTLAGLASLVLAVLMTWPTLRYPQHTIPQDVGDPTLQAWQMAWSGHILLADPTQLFQSNTFFPERWSFAFSDMLLGYAPAGMIGTGPVAAVVRYNIIFVLAHALAVLGAYALVRQLGSGRIGAAVAAVSYTYAPWLLAQSGHLHIISNGGIPLALAMLARGHGWSLRHGYRPERRHSGWALGGWLVAAWQLSLGFGIGLPFAYLLGVITLVATVTWFARRYLGRAVRRPFGLRLLLADVCGGAIFVAAGALLSIPYFKVAQLYPEAQRSMGALNAYSPPPSGFFIAPPESRIWGHLHEQARAGLPWHPETTLLPGFVLYALAAGGLLFSIWTVRQRVFLLAGVLVTGVLAMGTRFFGGTFTYLPLFDHLPGWNGLRTPGRLMLWTTLLLGILAAGAISAFAARARDVAAQRIPPWPAPWLRLVTLLPLILVLVEGLNATPHPIVPVQPPALRTAEAPVLVLPSAQEFDENVMLWSTARFPEVVNGGSGFDPQQLVDTRRITLSFPDQTSVEYLRTLGVKTVVMLRDQVGGTPWEATIDLPVDSLGVRREEIGQAVVYRL